MPEKTIEKRSKSLGDEFISYPMNNRSYKRVIGTAFGTSLILGSLSFFTLGLFEMLIAVNRHGRALVLPQIPSLLMMLAFSVLGEVIHILTAITWTNHITIYDRR